jgi:hypothetical protein
VTERVIVASAARCLTFDGRAASITTRTFTIQNMNPNKTEKLHFQ